MGRLRFERSGQELSLPAQLVIGRAEGCSLRITNPCVSGVHAHIRWTGETWCVRDACSKNGTFVGSLRVPSIHWLPFREGDILQLGGYKERWVLVDDSPPPGGVIDEVTDHGGTRRPRDTLSDEGELHFLVNASSKLLHIDVWTSSSSARTRLEPRAHHGLLYALAQENLRTGGSHWVDVAWLSEQLGVDSGALNVHVHRLRQELAPTGLPPDIIARSAGSIRLGDVLVRVDQQSDSDEASCRATM